MTRRVARTAVSLLLTAALLTAFLWNVDLDEVGAALGKADPVLLAVAVSLALASYWARAWRWQLLLRPVGRVSHASVVLTTAVGYAAITLLPARIGEIVRPLLLTRRERLPLSATVASVLTERVFDLWTVLAFFLVFVVWPPTLPSLGEEAHANLQLLTRSGLVVAVTLAAATAFAVALLRYQEPFVALVTRPLVHLRPRLQQGVARFLGHFLDGMRVIHRPRDLLANLAVSVLLWSLIYWQLRVTLVAFEIPVPLRATYLLVVLTVLGLAVPTPGGVGGFHKALQLGLTLFFGVGLNLATAVAIVYHLVCFGPITLLGLAAMVPLGTSIAEARKLADQPAADGSSGS